MGLFGRLLHGLGGTWDGTAVASPDEQGAAAADGALAAGGSSLQHTAYGAHAQYRWSDRDYEAEPSWFDGGPMLMTPPLRLDPVPRAERPPESPYAPMTDEMMLRAMAELREEQEAVAAGPFGLAGHGVGRLDGSKQTDHGVRGLPPPDAEMVREMLGGTVFVPIEELPWFGKQERTEEVFVQAMEETIAPTPAGLGAERTLEDAMQHIPVPEPAEESVAEPVVSLDELDANRDQLHGSLDALVQQAMPEREEMPEEQVDPWLLHER